MGIKGKAAALPKDKNLKFYNHHEAIIPQTDYDLVQQIRKKRSKENYRGSGNNYLFKGFCVCAECNHNVCGLMLRRSYDKAAYNCAQYVRYGKSGCGNKIISENDLLLSLRMFLSDTRYFYKEYLSGMDCKNKTKDLDTLLDKARKDKTKAEEEYRSFILLKHSELVNNPSKFPEIKTAQYEKTENLMLEKISRTDSMIRTLKTQYKNAGGDGGYMSIMDKIINGGKPDRKLLEHIIEKIYFHKDKSIEIKLKVQIPNCICE